MPHLMFSYVVIYLEHLFYMQDPPPLEVPLQLIEKDPKAKDIDWDADGVLVNSIDMDIF